MSTDENNWHRLLEICAVTTPPIPELPKAMIAAVAIALHDIDCADNTCSDTILGSVYAPRARRILAAALGVCEVREEWGARIWMDGGEAEAQDGWLPLRSAAVKRVESHALRRSANPPVEDVEARCWIGNARLIRRLAIFSPATLVEPTRCAHCNQPIQPSRSSTGWTHASEVDPQSWQGVRCPGEITGATPAEQVDTEGAPA